MNPHSPGLRFIQILGHVSTGYQCAAFKGYDVTWNND